MRVLIFLISFVVAFLFSCTTTPKPIDPLPIHVCLIRVSDNMCWFDKAKNLGVPLSDLDGYFAQPKHDMTEILLLLNQCGPK